MIARFLMLWVAGAVVLFCAVVLAQSSEMPRIASALRWYVRPMHWVMEALAERWSSPAAVVPLMLVQAAWLFLTALPIAWAMHVAWPDRRTRS